MIQSKFEGYTTYSGPLKNRLLLRPHRGGFLRRVWVLKIPFTKKVVVLSHNLKKKYTFGYKKPTYAVNLKIDKAYHVLYSKHPPKPYSPFHILESRIKNLITKLRAK